MKQLVGGIGGIDADRQHEGIEGDLGQPGRCEGVVLPAVRHSNDVHTQGEPTKQGDNLAGLLLGAQSSLSALSSITLPSGSVT
jgi:hypothetical protein